MKLSDLCISKPVFTIVINLLLIIIGLVGFSRLEVREMPKLETGMATITTIYIGADADLIENQITTKIENELAGIEGLDVISSTSQLGSSNITVKFKPGYDFASGLNEVRDKLGIARGDIPKEAEAPILVKTDVNSTAMMYISFNDTRRSDMALTDYVKRFIKPEVEQVEGVGTADIIGAREYSMRIWLDPQKMAARNVTVQEISNVLNQQNVSVPAGQIKSTARNYTIIPNTRLQNAQEFNNLIIRDEGNGQVVKFSDIGKVMVGPLDEDTIVRVDGKPAVLIGIVAQPTANPVNVSRDVIKLLNRFQKTLPQGMTAHVVYNKAVFIDESIKQVYHTLFEAVVLVVLVVFGFLGSFRSTSIPIVTIPLCLIGTFGLIYAMGYSINTMTLLALVLAIGLVVDDAIVMLENIHRHIEEGMSPLAAAFKGSREIGFAIVAMTITLAAVYAPIGFTPGIIGDVFREFAFTLAAAVIVSGFVALTLSPMMCSRVLTAHSHNWYTQWLDKTFEDLKMRYRDFLNKVLVKRAFVLVIIGAIAFAGFWQLSKLRKELAPVEDRGTIIGMIVGPSGATVPYLFPQLVKLEQIFDSVPEKETYVAFIGYPTSNSGISFFALKEWSKRDRSQSEIVSEIQPKMWNIPGALVIPREIPAIGGGGNFPIDFVVQITGTYAELMEIMNALQGELAKNPSLLGVQVDLKMDSPQLKIQVNRDAMADLQIDMSAVTEALSIMMAGRNITDFEVGGESYEVKVQTPTDYRRNPEQINNIYVKTRKGIEVPLSSVVTVRSIIGADSLPHYNRLRAAHLTANLAPGYTQGDAVNYIQAVAERVLKDNAKYTWAGQTKDFLESSGAMRSTILLALIFIYLVLAAQFESFRDPLVILLTVPFSVVGAAFLLRWTGGTLNIYTQIGLVTLIGLITKHGIMITEFANQLQEQGVDFYDAIVESAVTRLRPILMTTGAMVLGAIPLAIASGAGAYSRQQIGAVIVGGMSVGTVFSLIVVPVAYTLIAKVRKPLTEHSPLNVALREAEGPGGHGNKH
jgi:multidrug efflux pump